MNLQNKILTAAEIHTVMDKLNELDGFPSPALESETSSAVVLLKDDSEFKELFPNEMNLSDEFGQRNDENPRGATSYRGGGWHPDLTSLKRSGGHSFHPST